MIFFGKWKLKQCRYYLVKPQQKEKKTNIVALCCMVMMFEDTQMCTSMDSMPSGVGLEDVGQRITASLFSEWSRIDVCATYRRHPIDLELQ